MAAEVGLTLKEIIKFLKTPQSEEFYKDWTEVKDENNEFLAFRKDDFECDLHWKKVQLYEIDASEYLSFAKQDVNEDSDKGRINALSNAKRALECRVDELLTLSNFKVFSSRERWNLPYKMQVLQAFGVPTPDILRRLISAKRNILEHEYIKPNQQEVQDGAELAELFLAASRPHVERGYIASATVTYDSWFNPGISAPTWFEKAPGEKSRRYEYHDSYRHQYKLEFDLNEAITLSYSLKEGYRRYDLRIAELVEQESESEKKGPVTMPLRECDMNEVRELMILLRQRGE